MSHGDITAAQWLDRTSEMVVQEYADRRERGRRQRLAGEPERAIGVIRVSKVGKRKLKGEDRFVSPREQQDKLRHWSESQGIHLVAVYEEFDVSGKTPLAKRPGLKPAIEAVERGAADVVIVAYFDRLVRSLTIQAEILDRVERSGGKVVALDIGEVSNETAASWLNATLHGMMAEYHVRITREKTAEARRDAVARGVAVFPNLPPGYRRTEAGPLEVVPDEAAVVVKVFDMRASGASLSKCRDYLKAHGIERSYRATQTMFTNRLYLGEIHFGKLVNLSAHQPLIEREVFARAGAGRREPRGRPAKSDRLLARLGVLVCGSCGARLTTALVWNRTRARAHGGPRQRYAIYRCGMPGDCPSPVTISATLVEERVVSEVRQRLVDRSGSASLEQEIREAANAADKAQRRLKNAIELFTGDDLDDIEEAQHKLAELRAAARLASERYEQLKGTTEPLTVLSATQDWDELTVDGRRALIRAVLPRVEILPAAPGLDRIKLF
jgi:DNA invertase Pin-like site-specific DNA recombinase